LGELAEVSGQIERGLGSLGRHASG
jgi:hypothetical protein